MTRGFRDRARTLPGAINSPIVAMFAGPDWRWASSRVRLNEMAARVNSIFTLSSPRNRNRLIPRCSFNVPQTGSTRESSGQGLKRPRENASRRDQFADCCYVCWPGLAGGQEPGQVKRDGSQGELDLYSLQPA